MWVEVGTGARRTDRVAVDIVRPREPAEQGRRVPVIMDASPYYSCCGRGNESQKKTYDERGNPVQFPLYYDNYFVPRGYAVVLVDLAGTNRSDGCVDVGGRSDVRSAKAVVDWLNGRARGYGSRTGGTPVTAGWSTGAVGMIGKSYDGTVANGVAATGVDGLKTIVPIGAISSWYDYYFAKGAALFGSGPDGLASRVESDGAHARCSAVQRKLVEGAPRNGDWTPLWSERDYVRDAGKVKASVFAVHGMQDLNVRTKHLGQWWDALAAHGVERKIWLSQTGHVDPFDFRREAWVPTLHRWFDHYLLGYDNGIEREPMADVERAPDRWSTDRAWPPAGTRTTTLRPAAGPVAGVGTLGLGQAAPGTTTKFTDDPRRSEADWSTAVDRATPDKAGFVTRPLTRDLRLSGSSTVRLRVTPSHLVRPSVGRPRRPGPGLRPRLRGRRRGHPHPARQHLLGQRHHRRHRLLQAHRGRHQAGGLHRLQPGLGRPGPLRLRAARPVRDPRPGLHHHPRPGRHRPRRPGRAPPGADRRRHGRGADRTGRHHPAVDRGSPRDLGGPAARRRLPGLRPRHVGGRGGRTVAPPGAPAGAARPVPHAPSLSTSATASRAQPHETVTPAPPCP
ncbi:hypothetical protein GCM10020221_23630 [Streptomyces thioluteus]|uniref:Xaa-Pro dipeptidyl-peptidase C-terminal domain-containing protein n=1 Tax=Streptomyces thioluteus TaxID=66431 RepID=A0ABP6JD69_STRTU